MEFIAILSIRKLECQVILRPGFHDAAFCQFDTDSDRTPICDR